jgi:hypothetical protein
MLLMLGYAKPPPNSKGLSKNNFMLFEGIADGVERHNSIVDKFDVALA